MREIKFRVWDKIAKMIIPWEYLTKMIEGNVIPIAYPMKRKVVPDNQMPSHSMKYIDRRGNPFIHPEFVLMQYTGLKDMSGKEIYEGDVVFFDGFDFIYEVVWSDRITYDSGGALCSGFYIKSSELEYNIGLDECSIVGNIYENPRLKNKVA